VAIPHQFLCIFLVYAVSSLAVFIAEASAFSAAVGIALCMQKT